LLRSCRTGTRIVSVHSRLFGWPATKELLVRVRRFSWRVGLWYT
jgi:hypothetical protein